MNKLRLGLLLSCILLENSLYLCAVISAEDNYAVDILKDSVNIFMPNIQNFPKKVSVSFNAFNDHQNGIGAVEEKSKKNDFENIKSNVLKAIYEIDHSKSVKEMAKGLKQFPTNIFDENQHQHHRKLKKEFNNVMQRADTVLRMATDLEKCGDKKTKNQIAKFNADLQYVDKLIKQFTNKFNLESKKQRNESLKMIRNSDVVIVGDIDLLKNAKRSIDFMDLVNKMIEVLKSIPIKLRCLVLGYCEDENDNNGNNNNGDNNSNGPESEDSNGNNDNNDVPDDHNDVPDDHNDESGSDNNHHEGNNGSDNLDK